MTNMPTQINKQTIDLLIENLDAMFTEVDCQKTVGGKVNNFTGQNIQLHIEALHEYGKTELSYDYAMRYINALHATHPKAYRRAR